MDAWYIYLQKGKYNYDPGTEEFMPDFKSPIFFNFIFFKLDSTSWQCDIMCIHHIAHGP